MANVGEVIRVLRKKRGLSQAEMADLIGLKRSALGNYERGIREPDLDTLELIADFFDVSIADLVGRPQSAPDSASASDNDLWTMREADRKDPDRRALFMLSKYGSAKDIRQANAIIDALKATNPDFYDGDDPA